MDVISDECEERTKQNAGHESKAQNEDLYRKMSEDFDIIQEEVFFGKVRKLCFLCSCISQKRMHDANILRHPPSSTGGLYSPPPPQSRVRHIIL